MRTWSEERILAYCASKGWRAVVMADQERKKYDSQAYIGAQNARLAKEPQIIEGGEKPMVKLTFALESRSERHSTLWIELTVNDRQADLASYLEKGDTLGWEAFPALRRWGDDGDKLSFEGVRAELFPSIDLIMKAKERGWEPGAGAVKGKGGKGAAKKGGKVPPKGKKPAKREVQDLDEEDLDGDEN